MTVLGYANQKVEANQVRLVESHPLCQRHNFNLRRAKLIFVALRHPHFVISRLEEPLQASGAVMILGEIPMSPVTPPVTMSNALQSSR